MSPWLGSGFDDGNDGLPSIHGRVLILLPARHLEHLPTLLRPLTAELDLNITYKLHGMSVEAF